MNNQPYPNHASRDLDVTVYGATSFVGKLIVEYLQKTYGSSLKWGMAGRNLQKLQSVRDKLGVSASVPLLVAECKDSQALDEIAKRSKVVISTVGPYSTYGETLVEVCVDNGTDYLDLCGEANFIRRVIGLHGEKAKLTGSRIISSAGFDSLPSELGVLFLQELANERFGMPCNEIRARVEGLSGEFSGGTAESFKVPFAMAMEDPVVMDHLINPFSLVPGFQGPEQQDDQNPLYEEDLNTWSAPFFMGSINRQNVLRSNALQGFPYGKDFRYSEMMFTGPHEEGKAKAHAIAEDNWIMSDEAPKSGDGPSREVRESGFYDILFLGTTSKGNSLSIRVHGDMDPGYGSTSKIVSEVALCLIENPTSINGGVWTGGAAMGNHLINRLQRKAGLTFSAVS